MRAAGSPLTDRAAATASRLFLPAWLGLVGAGIVLGPDDPNAPAVGEVVAYGEDRLGRPWRVTGEDDLGRYTIRNGRVVAVADPDEIAPYEGPPKTAAPLMAGEHGSRQLAARLARQR